MNKIKSYKSVIVTVEPFALKLGSDKSRDDLEYFRFCNRGNFILNDKIYNYLNSYNREQNKTVRVYKDLLIGTGLDLLHRSVLTTDEEYTNLTNQAKHLYTNYDISKFWQIRKRRFKFNRDSMSGLFSCFSWLLQDLESKGQSPLELGKELLSEIWRRYGTNDIEEFREIILKDESLINKKEKELNQLWSSGERDPSLVYLRQNLFVPEDWNDLPNRLLLGEYREGLLEILDLQDIKKNSLEIFPPYNTVGFFVAKMAEGLLDAADNICQLPEERFYKDLDDIILYEIKENIETFKEAGEYLQLFNTIEEVERIKERICQPVVIQ